jgi:hypothetical protein
MSGAVADEQRSARFLRDGLPAVVVAVLAAVVLVGILVAVGTRGTRELRGYGQVTLSAGGCSVSPDERLNVLRCERVGDGVYRVFFNQPVAGSVVSATRGACCLGPVAASIESERVVLVVVDGVPRSQIAVSILVP